MSLNRLASDHQGRLVAVSDRAARQAVSLWRQVQPTSLDAGWTAIAPEIERVVSAAQVDAARASTRYVNAATREQSFAPERARIVPEAFGGVTREGRSVAPELYAAVTTTKTLIGRGLGVGRAFQAGTAFMSVMAATLVRDAGRGADSTLAIGKGHTTFVRVVQPGACSRCAILAGVKGYRANFKRHPGCRCTSIPVVDDQIPDGMFGSPGEYFDSLDAAEQARVFTKAGAEAIRLGADPIKVVNARRGALTSKKYPDGTFSPARLRPTTIGRRADGSPLQVYATPEGTTSRGQFGRGQTLAGIRNGDRYRRTSTLRLMPEQIISMSQSPAHARELLRKYGYLY